MIRKEDNTHDGDDDNINNHTFVKEIPDNDDKPNGPTQ